MAVTIETGKTTSRYARILLDGSNLSGDARQMDSLGVTYSETDGHGWSDDLDQVLLGRGNVAFGNFQALFNSTQSSALVNAGAFRALGSGSTVEHGTVFLGIQQDPQIGCPAFSADVKQNQGAVDVDEESPVMIQGGFFGEGSGFWGKSLAVGVDYGATASLGSIDNGQSTSDGFQATLHVAQSASDMAGNSWSIKLEHSADDAAWSDLSTDFTLDGTSLSGQMIAGTGTVNRYVRAVLDKAGGQNIRPWINFKRL